MNGIRRLDLSVLEQALSRFETALAEHAAEPQRQAFRDSAIMQYLFTYELVIQGIKRCLEMESLKSAEVGDLTFQNLIRRADDLGLLRTGWPGFSTFRNARNAVAHTYNEQRALEVVGTAREFATEARVLLHNLKRRIPDGD